MTTERRPFFTVIIPTHNREKIIPVAIDSVLRQTYADLELIVVDNGSSDGTARAVGKFEDPRIRYVWQENTGSPSGSRNTGIRQARGEYLCFLDSDDYWAPNKLARVKEEIDRQPAVDVVCHAVRVVCGDRVTDKLQYMEPIHAPVFLDLMTEHNKVATSSSVLRRGIADRAGLFPEDRQLAGAEDYDFWLRVAKTTDAFRHIPEPLSYYRRWEENLTLPGAAQVRPIRLVFDRHIADVPAAHRRAAEGCFAYFYARSHHLAGEFAAAWPHYRRALRLNSSVRARLKAAVLAGLCLLRVVR